MAKPTSKTTPSDPTAQGHNEEQFICQNPDPKNNPTTNIVAKTVLARHSTRAFCVERQVPLSVLEECLALAQHAPSSTNIQPWRLTIASGDALRRLTGKLTTAFANGEPLQVPSLPESFHKYRTELGKHVYGPNGYNIGRDHKAGQMASLMQNFRFYNAPYVAVICIPKTLNSADVLSVGIYLQTLILLLTEKGLGTQVSVAPAGYPGVIKQELGIVEEGEELEVLCTLGIGWENESEHINKLKMPRDEWRKNVNFVRH
jgi:nitroreductase